MTNNRSGVVLGARFIVYIGLFAAAGALYDSVNHIALLVALVSVVSGVEYFGFRRFSQAV